MKLQTRLVACGHKVISSASYRSLEFRIGTSMERYAWDS
jgi:hypothetical protein